MITTYLILISFFTICTESTDDCPDQNWPGCKDNCRATENKSCEPCEDGTLGVNCSEPCSAGYYGERCYKVCNCTEGEVCDTRYGCVENRTDDIAGITTYKYVQVTSKDYLSTTAPKSKYFQTSNSPEGTGTRRSDEADAVSSRAVIITGSCLIVICILSVIAYLCYSKSRKAGLVRHRRKSDRSGNWTDGNISQNAGLGDDECIYSQVNSVHMQELPLPCLPSAALDPLYGHADDAIYNTLSLKLKLDNKVLDPECDHVPKPPDSVSVTQVHSVYEEPSPFVPSDLGLESNSLVKTTVSGYTDNYLQCVDIPSLKRNRNTSGIDISGENEETKHSECSKSENVGEEIKSFAFAVKSNTENHSFRGSLEEDAPGMVADNYYIISKVEVENHQSFSKP
ncbi:uncharacterized protein LOC125672634 [Ostrea edulis]|uniref:uncharacterized protein LOC125672634 n=1 Tax=Ostrea edulis TaxID=37623 RepID=UPI0024AE9903|nr:uncharacterized protein LOC125672634 [Ostrea edulis]